MKVILIDILTDLQIADWMYAFNPAIPSLGDEVLVKREKYRVFYNPLYDYDDQRILIYLIKNK